jgi:hypothetical protein
MFRTYHLIAAISLPLVVAGCGDDASPPSEPRAETLPRPATRASATAVNRSRVQVRELAADAFFSSIDPSGCVETGVFVFGAEQAQKVGPGKPATGPLAFVSIFEFDFCTNQLLRDISGFTRDAVFQANRNKLTEARLQATILAFDNLSGTEVLVEVDVAWTGTGDLFSISNRFRLKQPGLLVSQWSKGTFRAAAASGTVEVGGENFATDATSFAQIFRARSGEFVLERTR